MKKFLLALMVALVVSNASSAAHPQITTYRLFEKSGPTGAYHLLQHGTTFRGQATFRVEKGTRPFNIGKNGDVLSSMVPFSKTYTPPVPASLHAVHGDSHAYLFNHADVGLQITHATWDEETSTIAVLYESMIPTSYVRDLGRYREIDAHIEINVSFFMVKS